MEHFFNSLNEKSAQKFLEGLRWNDAIMCPFCYKCKITELQGKAGILGQYYCNPCEKRFTVRTDTILKGSYISLKNWCLILYYFFAWNHFYSANELSKMLNLSHDTVYFAYNRINDYLITDNLRLRIKEDRTVLKENIRWWLSRYSKKNETLYVVMAYYKEKFFEITPITGMEIIFHDCLRI